MHKFETELRDATSIKAKKGEDRNDFLNRLVEAVGELDEADADNISDDAMTWYNSAVKALNRDKPIPEFPEAKKGKGKAKAEEPEEEEEEEAAEEASEEAPDEEEEDESGEEPEDEDAGEGKEEPEDEEAEEASEDEDEEETQDEEEESKVPMTATKKGKAKAAAKAAKPADKASKAGKAAKPVKKASKKGNGAIGRSKFGDDMKITVVNKENPYRDGTPANKAWPLFKSGQTVAAYMAMKGANRKWLRRSARKGFIKVA
jgi:hypothetical protein